MIKNQVYRLGPAVASIRRVRGMQQAALAQVLGMTSTRLSAIERSRVVRVSDDAVRRIARALTCNEKELEQLLRAAAYDRLISEVRRNLKSEYQVEIVSIALDAAQELVEAQARSVVSRLRRLVVPTAEWNRLPTEEEAHTSQT